MSVSGVGVIERESVELREFYVVALDDAGALQDVTDFGVEVGFSVDDDRPSTWYTAAWKTGGPFTTVVGSAYIAQAQIGGTGSGATIELDPNSYKAFVRVSADVETPVLDAGSLLVL